MDPDTIVAFIIAGVASVIMAVLIHWLQKK